MITTEGLEALADMAKINLADDEKTQIVKTINEHINCFNKLNDIETTGVLPMELITTESNVLREDIVEEPYDRDLLLSNAYGCRDGYFSVPQIVE